jgi:hypothetical protein
MIGTPTALVPQVDEEVMDTSPEQRREGGVGWGGVGCGGKERKGKERKGKERKGKETVAVVAVDSKGKNFRLGVHFSVQRCE